MPSRTGLMLAITLSLLSTACDKKSENKGCEAQPTSLAPFSENQKVVLQTSNTITTQSVTVAKGTPLTVVVDQSCRGVGRGIRSHTWVVDANTTIQKLNTEAVADKCIIGVGPSLQLKTFSNDPALPLQEHLATTKLLSKVDAYFNPITGIRDDVVIAIIDTGVELAHEDLQENIWVNPKEISNNGVDDDGNGYIDDVNGYNFNLGIGNANARAGQFHGTHVAGLAAARLGNGKGGAGVMGQKVKIMSLNVFDDMGGADTANADNAIRYAADNGAHVINMSLGAYGAASSTEQALAYAVSKGVVVVVAAGNDNHVLDRDFMVTPASYGSQIRGMLTVGSIDTKNEGRSTFSNFSPLLVEIVGPGSVDSVPVLAPVGLYSTMLGNRYERFQGTSMASPVVAGVAALAVGLVHSRGGKVKPAQIEDLLTNSSRTLSPLKTLFKAGVVDVEKLYETIDELYPFTGATPEPTPAPTPTPKPTAKPTPTATPTPGPTSEPLSSPAPSPVCT